MSTLTVFALIVFAVTYILMFSFQKIRPYVALVSAAVFIIAGSSGIFPEYKYTLGDAIDEISNAINYVSKIRSRLGAYQNRLESTSASLDVTEENMTESYSRIMDLDMAAEMTEYTTNQVLVQAGTSMLVQANERPQQVLQLLQ